MAVLLAVLMAVAGIARALVTPTHPSDVAAPAAGLRDDVSRLPLERTILSYNPVAYWPLTQAVPDNYENLGRRSDLVMKDVHTHGIKYVRQWPGLNQTAAAPVQAVQGLGHGVFSASLTTFSALASPPAPGSSRDLLPRGEFGAPSPYAFEFWFRRGSGSLQTTVDLNMVTSQYPNFNGGLSVAFMLPNCMRVYVMARIIRQPPFGDGKTPLLMRFRTQVCDAALASSRWHQVVVAVAPIGSGRIWLNGNEGVGWNGTFPCQVDSGSSMQPNNTEVGGNEPGFFCGDVHPPKFMVSDPWPLTDNGISIGDVGARADFGSISHLAVYDSNTPALQRIQADMNHLPTLTGGKYVVVPTSTLSYYLGRPTVAIVCDDPMHVLVGGPVQRVWMGAWSGVASTSVKCEAQPSVPFHFQWPWNPSEPSGADPQFWKYRAVVTVAINFSPLAFPPGSVAEDSLRIDIEEELSALMVHINPARIEANLVADEELNKLSPPALRLRVTFTPQRDNSGTDPWGPEEFHAHSALNSAVAAAEQLQTMLESPNQAVFGDRLWQLMPEASGGVVLVAEAPCVHAEGGFAKACSADREVMPGFVAAGLLVAGSMLVAMLAAMGEFDKWCPDPSGALDSLRAADPGFNGDIGRLGFDSEYESSVASGTGTGSGTGSGSRGGGSHSGSLEPGAPAAARAGGVAVPPRPKLLSQLEEDAAWIPVATDGSLVESLRAIRDKRWVAARSSSRAIIANSGSGPSLVPPGARAGSAMTSAEIGVVVRTTLQAPRAAMVVIPIATAAVVVINALVLVEFCLEQNGLGAIVTGLGLLGWFACNAVAACARHSSLFRPLWERGEGAPAACTSCCAPIICCFCGPKVGAAAPGICARVSGMACNLAFCWPCLRRLTCCQWVCGNGGPSACARDTFGLGCVCARSLVAESAATSTKPRSADRRSTAAGVAAGSGSLGQPSTLTLGSGSINGPGDGGSEAVPSGGSETYAAAGSGSGSGSGSGGGGGGGTLAGASWATGTVSTVARRRYEWTLATSMSGGLCGCIGAEMVRGLMRRNGDIGAESWQRHHPCWYAVTIPASIVFGPIWLQLHMSRTMPWGCCAMTWSIDADYAEAGADSLRRQTILGALVLGACVASYGFASVISTSVLTADTVPAQWTTPTNLTVTLLWLLYLIISALFSRFAAVDDDDAGYAVLAGGSEFDSVMMSTARGGRHQFLGSVYSDQTGQGSTPPSARRSPASVYGPSGGGAGPWGAAAGEEAAVVTEDSAASQPDEAEGQVEAETRAEETRDNLDDVGAVALPSRTEVPVTTYAVYASDAGAEAGKLDPRGEIHAGGALRDDGHGRGAAPAAAGDPRGTVAAVLVPEGAYLPGPHRAAHGRVVLPPLPPGTAGTVQPAAGTSAEDALAPIDGGGALR